MPLASERVRGVRLPPPVAYDDAAAAPFCAREGFRHDEGPVRREREPVGVGPDDIIAEAAPSVPSLRTGYAAMASAPRWVTMSVRPLGVNPICAGSASAAARGISPPTTDAKPMSLKRNDAMPGLPVFITNTAPARSATLRGASPPEETVPTSSSPAHRPGTR